MHRLKQLVMALILLLVLLLGVAFAAQNGTRVDVDLLLVQLPSTRLATLVLIAFVAGGLAGLGSSSLALARMGLGRRRLERQLERCERQLQELRVGSKS